MFLVLKKNVTHWKTYQLTNSMLTGPNYMDAKSHLVSNAYLLNKCIPVAGTCIIISLSWRILLEVERLSEKRTVSREPKPRAFASIIPTSQEGVNSFYNPLINFCNTHVLSW